MPIKAHRAFIEELVILVHLYNTIIVLHALTSVISHCKVDSNAPKVSNKEGKKSWNVIQVQKSDFEVSCHCLWRFDQTRIFHPKVPASDNGFSLQLL